MSMVMVVQYVVPFCLNMIFENKEKKQKKIKKMKILLQCLYNQEQSLIVIYYLFSWYLQ